METDNIVASIGFISILIKNGYARPTVTEIRESIHGKFRILNKRLMKGVKSLQGLYLNYIVGFISHGHTSSLKFLFIV